MTVCRSSLGLYKQCLNTVWLYTFLGYYETLFNFPIFVRYDIVTL